MTETPQDNQVQIPDAVVIESLREQLSAALSDVSNLRTANMFLSQIVARQAELIGEGQSETLPHEEPDQTE